jgi:hypothetical protein
MIVSTRHAWMNEPTSQLLLVLAIVTAILASVVTMLG